MKNKVCGKKEVVAINFRLIGIVGMIGAMTR